MPKRSNEFQRLVAMLTALSSKGAAVHESVELMEITSNEPREVDIVAVGAVAGYQTIVCIECRDWKRRQDVQWVEQANTKFNDLGANVRVLVSSSGFTKGALEKAARCNIKTITPGEITAEFVGKIVNSANRIEYSHWVTLVNKAEVVVTSNGVIQRLELPGNVPIFRADGSNSSEFVDLVNHVVNEHTRANDNEWEEAFRKGAELYGKGKVKFVATGDAPEPRSDSQKVYVKGISCETGEEALCEITNVIVTFEAERTVANVPLTHGKYEGTYYSTGSAPLGDGNTVQLVCTEAPDGTLDVIGRVDGAIASLGLQIPAETNEANAGKPAAAGPEQ
ncbi:restriction endonuclease [Mycobacterium sp. 360MFTsu5.1]|uniref:restriction endonuclease n=1 Tax=Mycobacterium sp. 360MFTsu5.1 TaxID=1172186 RepID=UPI0003A91781|nr:restriction endonuclease [Mycobacterium sp. 360MFTsu5.1]